MTAAVRQTLVPAGTWSIDPAHSSVGFAVKHMGIATVRGEFDRFAGSIAVDGDISTARVSATIDATTINTKEEQRDAHLRSADFFDVERFPELRFESVRVRALDGERFAIEGDLTMHGVTRPVELTAEVTGLETDPWGNERVGIELTGQLSRGEFGMRFNQALGSGNVLVSDRVRIVIDVSAIRQAAE